MGGGADRDELGQTLDETDERRLEGQLHRSVVRLSDVQRSQHQGDGRQQLDEDVERRAGGVLERVADGVTTTAAAWAGVFLPMTLPSSSFSCRTRCTSWRCPRPAAVVQDGGQQDAGDGPDHQEACDGLAQEKPYDDRRATATMPGRIIWRNAALVVMSTTRA